MSSLSIIVELNNQKHVGTQKKITTWIQRKAFILDLHLPYFLNLRPGLVTMASAYVFASFLISRKEWPSSIAELAYEIAMLWMPTSDMIAIAKTKFIRLELRSD